MIVRPSAAHGHEPTSSMGDDTALPPLAGRARPLFSYFRQRFAQVTNPAIDHIRERFAMSLSTLLGARGPLLVESPEEAAGLELESFFLYPSALDELAVVRIDASFDPLEGLAGACARIAQSAETAVREGHGMLLVSDADASPERPPVPSLLATSIVHHHLVRVGLRTLATLLVESDEPREVHHLACLLGFGAEAVCPRLALQTIAALAEDDRIGGDRPSPAEAQKRFKQSIEDGVLKVMSKLGISDIASYCGAQTFEALGLDGDFVERAFPGRRGRSGESASTNWRRRRSRVPKPPPGRVPASRIRATSSSARAASRTRPTPTCSRLCRRQCAATTWAPRMHFAVPCGRTAGSVTPTSRISSTGASRWRCATCSSCARRRSRSRSRRSSRPSRSCSASRRAACRTGRSRPRRTRRSRARSTISARGRTAAKAARTRSASGPTATRGSSRSRRDASASRPSTRRSPRSCRSRSRRGRSQARVASCRATR